VKRDEKEQEGREAGRDGKPDVDRALKGRGKELMGHVATAITVPQLKTIVFVRSQWKRGRERAAKRGRSDMLKGG